MGLLIQSKAQMVADSDRKMSMKLRPPTVLVSDSVTVLQQDHTWRVRPGSRKVIAGGVPSGTTYTSADIFTRLKGSKPKHTSYASFSKVDSG